MVITGYSAEIDAGQRFLEGIEPDENIVLLFHGDADGCCADEITRSPSHTAGRDCGKTGFALRFPRIITPIKPD